jgi:hypothetical protein
LPHHAGSDRPPGRAWNPLIRGYTRNRSLERRRAIIRRIDCSKRLTFAARIPDILGRRALPSRRLARLGATPDFHHGLLRPRGVGFSPYAAYAPHSSLVGSGMAAPSRVIDLNDSSVCSHNRLCQ